MEDNKVEVLSIKIESRDVIVKSRIYWIIKAVIFIVKQEQACSLKLVASSFFKT
jgi:hypothetical protein